VHLRAPLIEFIRSSCHDPHIQRSASQSSKTPWSTKGSGRDDSQAQGTRAITPKYKECEGNSFPTHFEFNGCDYLFTNEKGRTATEEGTHTAGPLQIKCPAGKSITAKVTVFGSVFCTITIPAQTPKNQNLT
jgi:hypothetical protein